MVRLRICNRKAGNTPSSDGSWIEDGGRDSSQGLGGCGGGDDKVEWFPSVEFELDGWTVIGGVGDGGLGVLGADATLAEPDVSLVAGDDGVLWPDELIKSDICWVM